MWESRRFLARFPRGSWEEWEAAFGFPRFPQPRHFHSSLPFGLGSVGWRGFRAAAWLLRTRVFLLLTVL
jgi:hypothetical protein